jgi:hypothetical protein
MSFDPVHKVIPAFVVGEINQENADRLIAQTQAVNDGSLHVFFSDQRPQYREAILKAFGQWMQPERQGQRGRRPKPRWVPPPDLLYAQVVKHRRKGRVVKVTTEVVFGTPEALGAYRKRSPASRRVNTAFVERQNNTMRQHNRRFTRKTLGFSKKRYWMERQLHLCVGDYHFCLPHSGLREEIDPPLPTKGNGSPKKWREVTPMMAAGVTDHVWTLQELLMYRVPPRAPENIVSIDEGHQSFPEMVDPFRQEIGQVAILAMIPDHFDRVQLRRISRQPDHFHPVRMLLLEKPNRFPMGAVPIQNQDEFLPHMPMHQAQEGDHSIETYVLLMNLKEQTGPMPHRGETDPGHHGEPVVPIPTVLHGGLPFRRPCPANQWLQPIATLVYKQDRPAVLPGLFFTSSHVWARQVRMAASSRSRARRWGFWGLHPISRSRYQTRPGW